MPTAQTPPSFQTGSSTTIINFMYEDVEEPLPLNWNLLSRGYPFDADSKAQLSSRRRCSVRSVGLCDPTENTPTLSRDRCSNTPVALCFLWYRRLSLLHPHFLP